MNAVLSDILNTRRVVRRDGSTIPLDYSISVDEGMALQRIIREKKPRVTLEIGLAYGLATLFICEALQEVGGERHIVMDPAPIESWNDIGLFNIERAGYGSLLEFHHAPSHRVLPELEKAGRRVGVALIDGWHTFDYAMVDFFYVDRLLDVGGVVVFDDTEFYPAVRKLARYVATHRRYTPLSNGIARTDSPKRRAFSALASVLRSPALLPITRHVVRPDVLRSDSALGLPRDNHIAFEKTGDDVLGDGSDSSRTWDQHVDF